MPVKYRAPYDEHALADSAHELQRAAGHVQKHAAASDQVPALGITLAHVEEALDRLSVGMLRMANGVVDWSAEQGPAADEDVPPAEAQALCFHLRAVSEALRAPRDACTSSRIWTRRLLDAGSAAAQESEVRQDSPHAACGSRGHAPLDALNPSPVRS